jgi:hypothetical protein
MWRILKGAAPGADDKTTLLLGSLQPVNTTVEMAFAPSVREEGSASGRRRQRLRRRRDRWLDRYNARQDRKPPQEVATKAYPAKAGDAKLRG